MGFLKIPVIKRIYQRIQFLCILALDTQIPNILHYAPDMRLGVTRAPQDLKHTSLQVPHLRSEVDLRSFIATEVFKGGTFVYFRTPRRDARSRCWRGSWSPSRCMVAAVGRETKKLWSTLHQPTLRPPPIQYPPPLTAISGEES